MGWEITKRRFTEKEQAWLRREMLRLARIGDAETRGAKIEAWVAERLSDRYEAGYQCGYHRALRGSKQGSFRP